MEKTQITVIVPIYNVEKYISKCLTSLMNQTFKNFQVWAVSDGSPDNSEEVVKRFQKKDNRIKLFVKQNGGYGSVLEYAIKKINTKYFLVCDPDDWLKENALECLYHYAKKDNLDLVVGNKYLVHSENGKKEISKSFSNDLKVQPYEVVTKREQILSFMFGEVSPHAKLYKTVIAKNINFPHKVGYTDTILYALSVINSTRVEFIDEELAYYLIDRPGNTMTAKVEKKIYNLIIMWQSLHSQIIKDYQLSKDNTLMYFLYVELKYILKVEAELPGLFKLSNYNGKIYSLFKLIQPYKKNLLPYLNNEMVPYTNNGRVSRLFFKGFMNKRWYRIFIILYVYGEKIKK